MVVISLGGSVINGEELDINYIREFRSFMKNCNERVFVVVGGGYTARKYIHAAKELGWDQYTLDRIGIMATHLNAKLLLTNTTNTEIPRTVDEAVLASKMYKNIVMGGTEPGHTTDGVALLLAERTGADYVINITSVGGIYDKDPRVHKDAKLIESMSYAEALSLLTDKKMNAGLNVPLDMLALKIAERSNIKIYIVGTDIENIKKVINNADFQGTVIK